MTMTWRATASLARFSTSFWNTGWGGPSIDSNATVAPWPLASMTWPFTAHAATASASADAASRRHARALPSPVFGRLAARLIDTSRPDAPCCVACAQGVAGRPFGSPQSLTASRESCGRRGAMRHRRRHPAGLFFHQRDGVDVASVVRLGAMGGAAVGVEARVAIGAQTEILDARNTGGGELRRHVPGEIEHGVAFARRQRKEARVVRISRAEAGDELGPDLVVRLADHRADGRHNARALR